MPRSLSRKELLRGFFTYLRETGEQMVSPSGPDLSRALRPPGALVPDASFLAACTGCEKCVAACPPGALFMAEAGHEGGVRKVAVLLAVREPCRLCEGLPCVAACTDGALAGPLAPDRVRLGVAQVNPNRCRAFRDGECDLCLRFCPYPEQAIRMIRSRPVVIPDACTGCGMCEAACPERPRAIVVVPERDLIPGVRLPRRLPV
jgi:ferredoxin-type protein NapG